MQKHICHAYRSCQSYTLCDRLFCKQKIAIYCLLQRLWKIVEKCLEYFIDTRTVFFLLSNDAVWRQSEKFATQYLNHICSDADQLFLQPYAFIDSTYAVLEKSKINFCQNTDDFLIGIKNFTKTCFDLQVLNNVQNLAWLAWCHAIHLVLNLPCPMDITTEFDQYVEMIHSNQDFYTNFTVNNFILSQARNTI